MLDIFKEYAVDLKAETKGVWRQLGTADFLIARSDNEEYLKHVTESWDANREKIEKGGKAADKLSTKLMAEIIADTILLDWKNVGFEGVEMPYSRDNVVKLFTDPSLRDFHNAILRLASEAAAYRVKEEEKETKNS